MDDGLLLGLAALALGAHLAALPWVWRGRRPRLLALMNLLVALPVLWMVLPLPGLAAAPPLDGFLLALAAFEGVAALCAFGLAADWRRLRWLNSLVFSLHALASGGAFVFALAFRIARLA